MRVSVAEYESLRHRAGAVGLTVPAYLVVSGLRPDGLSIAEARAALTDLSGARRLLAGAANNLNQLTAKLHSTGEMDAALPVVLAAVLRLTGRVDAAVVTVGRVAGHRPSR